MSFLLFLGKFYTPQQLGFFYLQGQKWMGMGHQLIGIGMINGVAQPVLKFR